MVKNYNLQCQMEKKLSLSHCWHYTINIVKAWVSMKHHKHHKKKHLQNEHPYLFPTRSFGGGDIDNNSTLEPALSFETSPNMRSLDIF